MPTPGWRPDLVAAGYAERTDWQSQTSPDPVHRGLTAALDHWRPDGPLLDVGTGIGSHLGLLRRFGAAVGLDVALVALAQAREHAPVVNADAGRLPIADAAFGTVVCTEVLEHVADPAAVIDELARVLRPGGLAVLSTPNYANLVGLHKWWADRSRPAHDWNPWGAHSGGYEAFLTGRRLARLSATHFELVQASALDYGQALTGRFGWTDRVAQLPAVRRRLELLVPWLERPHPRLGFLAWHGMHIQLVLRRRCAPPR